MTYRHQYSFDYESQVGPVIGVGYVCHPLSPHYSEEDTPANSKLYLLRYDFLDPLEAVSFFYQAPGAVKIEYEY